MNFTDYYRLTCIKEDIDLSVVVHQLSLSDTRVPRIGWQYGYVVNLGHHPSLKQLLKLWAVISPATGFRKPTDFKTSFLLS
jgi:hypothetical protein